MGKKIKSKKKRKKKFFEDLTLLAILKSDIWFLQHNLTPYKPKIYCFFAFYPKLFDFKCDLNAHKMTHNKRREKFPCDLCEYFWLNGVWRYTEELIKIQCYLLATNVTNSIPLIIISKCIHDDTWRKHLGLPFWMLNAQLCNCFSFPLWTFFNVWLMLNAIL